MRGGGCDSRMPLLFLTDGTRQKMLKNIPTNYATSNVHADTVWTTLFSSCPTLYNHLARQASSWVGGQVLYCLCLIFMTKLHSLHITVSLEYVISSNSKVTPSQWQILHPSSCNTLQEAGKQHLLFYFHRSSYSPARWYHFVLEWPETNTVLLLYEIPEGINGFL